MRKKISKKLIFSYILGTIFLIIAIDISMASGWVLKAFPDLDFNALMFHLMVPLEGTNMDPFYKIIAKCILLGPVCTLLILWFITKCQSDEVLELKIHKLRLHLPLDLCNRFYCIFTFIILLAITAINVHALGIDAWIRNQTSSSTIFDDYYVPPQEVAVSFPDHKRNLIYIFMESMETTYASTEYGGNASYNLIPEMVQLSLDNTNFTGSNTYLNGAYSPTGTTWTISAMVAQTAGIPLLLPIDGNSMDAYSSFLPGAYTIGDMLKDQGYTQEFLLGSDVTFGGRKNYMSSHGDYNLLDYYYAIQQNWIAPDYYVFWGYEDQKLYEYAKNELTKLSAADEPFNLTMLTVDTHFIDGYYCELCESQYPEQYSNVISCASYQLNNFISWIQQQDFYANTTIVIAGDHPAMDTAYLQREFPDVWSEERCTYIAIINPAVSYDLEYDRVFTTLDLYPTTIAALGADIEGEKLGLGVNLFSDTPTLAESIGLSYINEEFSKTSNYYNRQLLY